MEKTEVTRVKVGNRYTHDSYPGVVFDVVATSTCVGIQTATCVSVLDKRVIMAYSSALHEANELLPVKT